MILGGCFGSRGFLSHEHWEAAVDLLRDHALKVEVEAAEEGGPCACWIRRSAESKAGVLVLHDAGGGQQRNVLVLCKTPLLRVPFVSPKVSEAEEVLQEVMGVLRLYGFVAGPV